MQIILRLGEYERRPVLVIESLRTAVQSNLRAPDVAVRVNLYSITALTTVAATIASTATDTTTNTSNY